MHTPCHSFSIYEEISTEFLFYSIINCIICQKDIRDPFQFVGTWSVYSVSNILILCNALIIAGIFTFLYQQCPFAIINYQNTKQKNYPDPINVKVLFLSGQVNIHLIYFPKYQEYLFIFL